MNTLNIKDLEFFHDYMKNENFKEAALFIGLKYYPIQKPNILFFNDDKTKLSFMSLYYGYFLSEQQKK